MKTNRFKKYLLLNGSLLMLIPGGVTAQQNRISIDASHIVNRITPYLYGACIEDVNHEIYGGLYDQKIFGESFEEPRTWNSQEEFRNLVMEQEGKKELISYSATKGLAVSAHWDAIQTGDAKVTYLHDDKEAYNGKYSQVILKENDNGIAGIANRSLNRWGISVEKGQTFQGRLYLKGEEYKGTVTVALQSADGTHQYAAQTISALSGNWEKYPFSLLSNNTDPNSRLAVYIDRPGKVWVDQVVLMSTGDKQFHGLPFRNDIGQAMQKQGLTFLRYGGTMVNASEYRFKKMIGDPDKRPPYKGHWNAYSTNGFGIEEFLKFCEAAGFEAAFAVNIEETPEDIADMVEYLNGPVSSVWGKKRADNGHPKRYGVKYIEIGNEEVIHVDDTDGYRYYIERFNLLYDAIKSKDESVEVINSAWWRPESPNMEMVFRALNGKSSYWDYHPWVDDPDAGIKVEKELEKMQQLFLKWDPDTQMKCAIFEENGNLHSMQRALGHVTLQNAVRRHSDFVFTSCAANALQPYLQNDNGWDQGQVFFTPTQVWGMPPYYAQQMASENHLPLLVKTETTGPLDVTATKGEDGRQLVIHIANITDKVVEASMELKGLAGIENTEVITLAGDLKDRNTPEQPEKIVPVKKNLKADGSMKYAFPAYSYTILKYNK